MKPKKRITINVGALANWQNTKITDANQLADRVPLDLQSIESKRLKHGRAGVKRNRATIAETTGQQETPALQGAPLQRASQFSWPERTSRQTVTSVPILNLRKTLRDDIRKKDYGSIVHHISATEKHWPFSPRQYVTAMEDAIIECCVQNDPLGLEAMVSAVGALPQELCGRGLYLCSMRGNIQAAQWVIRYAPVHDKRRALFRSMELRSCRMIALILRDDKQKLVLNGIPAASGGSHVLLGHALELAAELGDLDLAQAALGHIYNSPESEVLKGHAPQSSPTSSPQQVATGRQSRRAHHWCWPSILRARHVAQSKGHHDVALALSLDCHDDRPSNPSTPRLSDAHSQHSVHLGSTLSQHVAHRFNRRWHPASLSDASVSDTWSIGQGTIGSCDSMVTSSQHGETRKTVVSDSPSVRSSRFYRYGRSVLS